MCGAFGGDMSGPNRNNVKGMFENAAIRNNIVKPYYRSIKVDPLGQYPLPSVDKMKVPTDWRERVEQVMVDQGYKSGPWMYKGAKMCQHWPVWNYAFPDAKWVIVRRKSADIVNSCNRTAFMRAFSNHLKQKAVGAASQDEGWLWWVHQHLDRFKEMIEADMRPMIVWPDRMVEGDFGQVKEMIDWLGLTWTDEVENFIDPKLWKSRNKK